mgnify:CR=1 FL=1
MVWKNQEYYNLPDSYVFDGHLAQQSYTLNKLFYSFNEESARCEFDKDPAACCDKFGLTMEQKQLVLKQNFLGVLRSGANIYYMAKFCIPRGVSVQDAGAAFQGITGDEFRAKLLEKREGLEERLDREGGYWNG